MQNCVFSYLVVLLLHCIGNLLAHELLFVVLVSRLSLCKLSRARDRRIKSASAKVFFSRLILTFSFLISILRAAFLLVFGKRSFASVF